MKISACNSYSDKIHIDLDRSLAEEEDFELCVSSMGDCLAAAIAELIKQTCETTTQGEVLADVILERIQLQLDDYIEQDLAKDLECKQEATLYEYMCEVFYRWLHNLGLTREKWIAKYRGSQKLTLEPILLDSGLVAIMFRNEDVGDNLMILDPKNRDTTQFNRALSESYIIGTIAGDLICGQDYNPIRQLPVGVNADGGLSEAIKNLLSNQ